MSEQSSRQVGNDWEKAEYTEAFLYDLKYDPHELTNLIDLDSHSEVRRVMRERLQCRAEAIGEPKPKINEVTELRRGGQRYVTEAELRQ